ncbi:DUF11 domain-containing protein [Candidatus Saccharibacteria bacterium]|nr:DUF11 domain-containing protein [Candidatus Saccharibacteria bacterium]
MKKLRALFIGVVVTITAFTAYALLDGDTTRALNPSARDCDTNSIIYCGAITPSELAAKFNANKTGELDDIYPYYGVTGAMINGMAQKQGKVTRDGEVIYNGKVVATNGYSIGRHYKEGSVKVVHGESTFWKRKIGTMYAAGVDAVAVHIWFDTKGQYVGAIMYSCGNPVIAEPVPVPVYSCDSLEATKISRTKYSFTTNTTAKQGAVAYSYAYDFGDGTTLVNGATVTHTYASPGSYAATVVFSVKLPDGSVVNAPNGNCATTVVVEVEPCPIPGKEDLPKDSPACIEDKPSVEITKKVNGKEHNSISVNELFKYNVVVENTGNVPLKNIEISDNAPEGVTFVRASNGNITDGDNGAEYIWTHSLAMLAVGDSDTFTIYAKITDYIAGTVKNTACVETPTVPGGNPDDCDDATIDAPRQITVCDTTTGAIISIDEKNMNEDYTKDLDRCTKIEVCRLEDKQIVVITKSQLDGTKYSEDKSKCAEEPADPKGEAPTELPKTGIADALTSSLGMGGVVGATYYYGASRRELAKAQLKHN